MRRFEGRRVLVTGAASGIGQGIAVRLLDEGATLVAADIAVDGLETVAELGATPVTVDIADEESVRGAYAEALGVLGGLDVLVNAAGILAPARTHEMSLADWNRTITVNLTGTFLMCREGIPTLLESPHGGVIVNFASTSAFQASPYLAAYSASKGAVNSFTHAIALEYVKQGLRAVSIVPGGITSGITTKSIRAQPEGYDAALFMKLAPWLGGGKLGTPADIAAAVAMVASDDGKFITGTELRIDGGQLM